MGNLIIYTEVVLKSICLFFQAREELLQVSRRNMNYSELSRPPLNYFHSVDMKVSQLRGKNTSYITNFLR